MRPRATVRGVSTYTVLGFAGYAAGSILGGILTVLLGMSLGERAIVVAGPPIAFLAVVRYAKRRAGYERIVFYEAAIGCAAAVAIPLAILTRSAAHVATGLDVLAVGLGCFLAFGRLGCFHVACCFGRPAKHGVRYGAAHVAVGFPLIWRDRPVLPVQLVEAAASAILAALAWILALRAAPGTGAAAYASGYAAIRFGLERVRGDKDRRYWRGLSEAQRASLACAALSAVLHPAWWTIAIAASLVVAAALLARSRTRPRRLLLRAGHVHEVAAAHVALDRQRPVAPTSEALAVSLHVLPDGRRDYIWSRPAGLPVDLARELASLLDTRAEVIAGRAENLVHVVVSPR